MKRWTGELLCDSAASWSGSVRSFSWAIRCQVLAISTRRTRSSGESAVRAICKHSQACRRYSLLVATQSPPRESSGRLPPAPMDYNNNMLNWFRKLQDISGCLAFRLCNEALISIMLPAVL